MAICWWVVVESVTLACCTHLSSTFMKICNKVTLYNHTVFILTYMINKHTKEKGATLFTTTQQQLSIEPPLHYIQMAIISEEMN